MAVGLVHTVVSISACGAEHQGSIPGLDSGNTINYGSLLHLWHEWEEQYECTYGMVHNKFTISQGGGWVNEDEQMV